mmetsp:Transcript_19534/g.29235  ORF Transcript_19534/g.29235 Transcript_19534/m.29235 type:complete len:85 (+) Transcript_19534:236-490(+)
MWMRNLLGQMGTAELLEACRRWTSSRELAGWKDIKCNEMSGVEGELRLWKLGGGVGMSKLTFRNWSLKASHLARRPCKEHGWVS